MTNETQTKKTLTQRVKDGWSNLRNSGVATLVGVGIVVVPLIYAAVGSLSHNVKKVSDFNNATATAYTTYGDFNHDGQITVSEENKIDTEILNEHNAVCYKNNIYQNGQRVPIETLTKWFREYKPSN